MLGDKIEIAPVFFRHGADAEIGLREIDAFGRTKLRPAGAGVHDLDQNMVRMHLADSAFDLAIVEENWLAGQRGGENFGKRAGDVRQIALRRLDMWLWFFVFGEHE